MPETFEFKYGLNTTRVTVDEGFIEIKGPMSKHSSITKNELKKIDFKNISNPIPNLGYCFYLYFFYERDGRQRKHAIILAYGDEQAQDLLQELKRIYPAADYIGPNEEEKKSILCSNSERKYRIHAIWPISWMIVLWLCIMPVGMMALIMGPGDMFSIITGCIGTLIGLAMLILLVMTIAKKLYFITTDNTGISYRKLMEKASIKWEVLNVINADFKEEVIRNRYSTGLDPFFLVQLSDGGKQYPLKLTAFMAGELYAELYYRGKVSLEQAQHVGAFY